MSYQIEAASDAERGLATALWREMEADRLYDPSDDYLAMQERGFLQDMARVGAWLLVARSGESVVGMVAGFPDDADPAHEWLAYMAVARDRRREGIGAALVERAIEALREREPSTPTAIVLTVHDDNGPARALYESLGWKWTGAVSNTPSGEALMTYARRLD